MPKCLMNCGELLAGLEDHHGLEAGPSYGSSHLPSPQYCHCPWTLQVPNCLLIQLHTCKYINKSKPYHITYIYIYTYSKHLKAGQNPNQAKRRVWHIYHPRSLEQVKLRWMHHPSSFASIALAVLRDLPVDNFIELVEYWSLSASESQHLNKRQKVWLIIFEIL